MKNLFLIMILVINLYKLQAQSIRVLDSITHEPVPYVTVITNDSTGFYTNEKGSFERTELAKFEKIRLTCVGYFDKNIEIHKIPDNTIFLNPKTEELKEVVLFTGKQKIKNIGYDKKRKPLTWHIDKNFELGTLIFPNFKNDKNYIKEIIIPIDNMQLVKDNEKWVATHPKFESVFKINIYSVVDNKPDRSLLTDAIVVYCSEKSADKLIVNIENENINFNSKGLFISIEMIGDLDAEGNVIPKKNPLPAFKFTEKSDKSLYSTQYFRSVFSMGWKNVEDEEMFKMVSNFHLAIGLNVIYFE